MDEQASPPDNHSTADYMRYRVPEKHSRLRGPLKMLRWLMVVALVLALLFFVFKALTKPKAPAATTPAAQQVPAEKTTLISTTTKHYDSPLFSMGIDHPADWAITEGSNKLSIASPAMDLPNVSGKAVSGKLILSVEQPGQPLPMFDKGNAVAVRDSKKVSYTRPTSAQRGQTYISFLQYPATDVGMDGVYITGDFGYLKDQAIPKVDVAKANPLISLTFVRCSGTNCSNLLPLSVEPTLWDNPDYANPLETMIRSITVN